MIGGKKARSLGLWDGARNLNLILLGVRVGKGYFLMNISEWKQGDQLEDNAANWLK